MMKFKFCFLLVPLLCCTFALAEESGEVQTYSTESYEYTLLKNGSAEIINYTDDDQVLEIPAELDGYSITSIGNGVFYNCDSLTSISIPDGVTSIGNVAFADCGSLTSISIPDGVTSIGDYAFGVCNSLTSISIPDSVTSIGDYAFTDCYSLTSISIPDSVTSIGDDAFANCENLTLTVGHNSFAYMYAQKNSLRFNYPDSNDWLSN